MYDCVKAFKYKPTLWANHLSIGNLVHFMALQSLNGVEPQPLKNMADIIFGLHVEFCCRSKEFGGLEKAFTQFYTPTTIDVAISR